MFRIGVGIGIAIGIETETETEIEIGIGYRKLKTGITTKITKPPEGGVWV